MKKKIFDYKRKAKSNSYGGRRTLHSIKGVVLHYTGNRDDTMKNNLDYFATSNTRSAGAHIFIDGSGYVGLSVPLRRIAWSVGNPGGGYFPGAYYTILNNTNTVSIELCDMVDHGITEKQLAALIETLIWLKKKCPNIEYIVRHYDIVKKECPAFYVHNNELWKGLKRKLERVMGLRKG